MSRLTSRPIRLLLAALAGAMLLSGCDFDVYKLPLPGGADTGSNPLTIKVQFADVLDLVPKSSVKVNDVTVGQVSDIDLDGYTATVTLEVNNDVDLPADAIAQIRQTSLLGEKFVSLEPPMDGGTGTLADHAEIPLSRTGRNPEVEEVFSALSLLLNGGGVAQLHTIVNELNRTLDGREDTTRSALTQIETFVGQLDDNKGQIVDAITSLNRLSVSVKRQQGSIDAALEELPSSLDSLDRQRDDLIRMLDALDHLSGVGVRVIRRSKETTLESLRQLQPVLTQLSDSGDDFVNSINGSLTYPFVDEVVGRDPQVARNLHMGDYTNLDVNLHVDLTQPSEPPGVPCTPLDEIPAGPLPPLSSLCDHAQTAIAACLDNPSQTTCGGLPAGVLGAVCQQLPIPGLCPGGGTTGRGHLHHHGGLTGGLPDVPGLGGLLGGIGGLLGRPAALESGAANGPTLRQLTQEFDPALATLLTPGMVLR